MTREEAIRRLKEARSTIQPFQYVNEAIDYAIKALEQQNELFKMGLLKDCEACRAGQEPRKGQWVKIEPYPLQMHDYECSECGHETDDNTENYCSNCGVKMFEL